MNKKGMISGWNRCQLIRNGKICGNPARHPNGSSCCTCNSIKYRQKHPDRYSVAYKNYYESKREEILEKSKKHYEKNREFLKLTKYLYRQKNKEKIREYNATRRKQLREARRALSGQDASAALNQGCLASDGQRKNDS